MYSLLVVVAQLSFPEEAWICYFLFLFFKDKFQITSVLCASPRPVCPPFTVHGSRCVVQGILLWGSVIGFPFIWQLLCNTRSGEDLAGSHHIFPPRRAPSEPVRHRQCKHAAEKEKPDMPKNHSETHTDCCKILRTAEG